ncbi:AAA family ATPase [Chitinophaga sp. 22321]|uniref:AAA family ATPase n=1 Tax=Chitinophaga hostae TaxID=2831022 RepID=A0ABS5J7Q7_9BACT|nr:AAA family ATPase [Chitinophaga hostae]MBS0030447.1 AAA family ATPase [Chitinophaga hostae]
MKKDNFFIITGGPGMGKTSLIEALAARGYDCVPETGRDIIRQQVAAGGNALPWGDREAFARLMFEQSLADFQQRVGQTAPVFFDRGIADTIGYLELCGLPVPAAMREAAALYRFNNKVFLTPPWKDIYEQDSERKQSFDLAVATCNSMVATYQQLQYELTVLPTATIAERIRFILSAAGLPG